MNDSFENLPNCNKKMNSLKDNPNKQKFKSQTDTNLKPPSKLMSISNKLFKSKLNGNLYKDKMKNYKDD